MTGGASRRTERLMCLVFMLQARGRRGVSRAELRAAIADYEACTSDAAFERMFERDKKDLRDVGVVLDVVQRDAWHEDDFAYSLGPSTLLTLPALTAGEMQVLTQAAHAWDAGAWQAVAAHALRKTEVFGDALIVDPHPRLRLSSDEHLAPLRRAIRERRSVTFAYRRPGTETATPRRVEPWGLIRRDGGWYLVGFDRDRAAHRVFRTSRIEGVVAPGDAATTPADPAWASIIDAHFAAQPAVHLQLLIHPERGWHWRRQGTVTGRQPLDDVTGDIVEVHTQDHDGLVPALAAAAPHVVVLAPADVRQRVIAHLAGGGHG